MKVYIVTDLEGVAGVINAVDFLAPGDRYYDRARTLTTLEVNAAIEGARDAGATEFLVVDGHGHGGIDPLLLDPEARVLIGRPTGYPFACDSTFEAAFCIGQHAKSNADGGHLSHTGSFACDELSINGLSIGELGCNMLFCGYFGVPMIFVSGDEACAREAEALVPGITTATVKWGVKRGSATGLTAAENEVFNGGAIHLSPERARATIRAAAAQALQRHREAPLAPFRLEAPYELVQTVRRTADIPGRRAVARNDDALELLKAPRVFEPVES